ncbi:hypothetical protein [Gordonia sputi]|nr:hypothetical protein [Gordonia sputi]
MSAHSRWASPCLGCRTHAIAEAMGQVLDDAEIVQLRDVMPLLDRLADAL